MGELKHEGIFKFQNEVTEQVVLGVVFLVGCSLGV
jgi:hypothetical protein